MKGKQDAAEPGCRVPWPSDQFARDIDERGIRRGLSGISGSSTVFP